ncbi:fibrobacter succinogenes major paralogous domain-containing protein, partial [Flavobacteriales bacterium]|nr:fibrobacter succinogenes major paralogous domain-containing protein [Flavobacteriales bacterium]
RLKATSTWADDGNGSNLTGFNAVGAGIRFDSGNFDFQGDYCYWWVRDAIVTVGNKNEMYRELFKGSSQVGRGVNAPSNYGYSVRCIKD